jgi:kexin
VHRSPWWHLSRCTQRCRGVCSCCSSSVRCLSFSCISKDEAKLLQSPDLTWRDIQYLCLETAKTINPEDPDWELTASGRKYSYKYGFGVLDAYKFVTAAQQWKLVKPQSWFQTEAIQLNDGRMDNSRRYTGGTSIGSHGVTSKITITKDMLMQNNLEALEHINVQVWIDHTRRGDVEVELISPNGIRSILAKKRSGDEATTGFPGWVFMTVKHW